ncbi:MAG: STAS domain-containing protein [Treponema sp.]|nr:STAS domain-containing protein [Treponema sp.]
MDQLKITEKNGANYTLLELSGVINSYTSQEFSNKVYDLIKNSNLVLEMSQVEAIDSTGVGIIMAGFNDGLDNKHKLYIMNPSPYSRKALDDTGFSDTFLFIHSVTEVQ